MELNIIQKRIYEIRGVRVMLDFDLADLYQVETKVLKQSVRRNLDRFPEDFMFELTPEEYNCLIISLRSQIVTSNEKGGRRYMPYAFTEHGVIMLASLLRSELAINASIQITRAFVAMRNFIMSTQHIESELAALKARLELLERNDEDNLKAINDLSEDMRQEIDNIYQAIAVLSVQRPAEPQNTVKKIGFK
ncbi:MAG: ORF6N domain-containing protein [Bacteroidales bacterium]|mgnify:FL=1|nr:ORF6N domain-containing protein [Bacteroidales bacterium]